jgi:hypothetical protein
LEKIRTDDNLLEHKNAIETCARKHVGVSFAWKLQVCSLRGSLHFDWRALASTEQLFVTHSVATVVLTAMADSADSAPAAPAQVSPKKTKSSAKKPRNKPVHPRTSEMVENAIKSLKERGGSSLQAIKKYIAANYKADSEKLSPFIKMYLNTAVASGELVQTKGKGASRSFKLAVSKNEKAAVPNAPTRGRAASAPKAKKQSAAKVKKAKAPKKAAVKSVEKKKRASPAAPKKSPSKVKKATKVPTKKPKAPRPKTAGRPKGSKKGSPKKK